MSIFLNGDVQAKPTKEQQKLLTSTDSFLKWKEDKIFKVNKLEQQNTYFDIYYTSTSLLNKKQLSPIVLMHDKLLGIAFCLSVHLSATGKVTRKNH